MGEIEKLDYRRHRAQVTTSDTTPALTEKYADLSAGTVALFKPYQGGTLHAKLIWTGAGARTATMRPYFIDSVDDTLGSGNGAKVNVLTKGSSFNIDDTMTEIKIPGAALGQSVLLVVTSLAANSALDIYCADDDNMNTIVGV